MLFERGFEIEVYIENNKNKFSADANLNFRKLKQIDGVAIKNFSDFSLAKNDKTIIIDAIFGYGLNRPITGKIKDIIEKLNQLEVPKIAIDIPAGLYADSNIDEDSTVFKADFTLTFQFYKRSFLHPETGKFCGEIQVLDINLNQNFINSLDTPYYVVDEDLIRVIYKPREAFSHKGTYGKSILVGGSYGKIGAVMMSSTAALRTGSGLTFTIAPECGNLILQTQVPEAMFIDSGKKHIEKIDIIEKAVYGIGPGLGTENITKEALFDFLNNYQNPVVLDADALNILAESSQLDLIPKNSVITPHPLEFERLFGKSKNSFDRIDLAKSKAEELQIFIVLKDHHTAVITPQKNVFYNITGNSGMAKGGSGDVLIGILTALISQNYKTEKACIFGVWLHGKAGDFAAEDFSKESMLPTDLINKIGKVFNYLSS